MILSEKSATFRDHALGAHSSGLAAATQDVVGYAEREQGKGADWRLFPGIPSQCDIAKSGFPLASLISAAQTFWIAPTTLFGIGT